MNKSSKSSEQQDLALIRRNRAKRPLVLRKASRDLSNIRASLIAAGYQPGDEVYEVMSKLIVAVAADLTS